MMMMMMYIAICSNLSVRLIFSQSELVIPFGSPAEPTLGLLFFCLLPRQGNMGFFTHAHTHT